MHAVHEFANRTIVFHHLVHRRCRERNVHHCLAALAMFGVRGDQAGFDFDDGGLALGRR